MLDYILVGQGIAGTCLAYRLLQSEKNILVLDNGGKNSSSKVAAGIINPITGRYYTKSWMIDQLLPQAKRFYQSLENDWQTSLVTETSVVRTLPNAQAENNWHRRLDQSAYRPYLSISPDLGAFEGKIHSPFSYGEITQALQVDLPKLLEAFRERYSELLVNDEFDYNLLDIKHDYVQYKNWTARNIIFCEGYRVIENPYFKDLPFRPAKGEILLARIPDLNAKKILRDRQFICPLSDGLYWLGSGYSWDHLNEEVTLEEKNKIITTAQNILTIPFMVEDHLAGVRPATKDRRPILGRHPQYPRLVIFNGMGTKGTSLSPYWSEKMVAYLEGRGTLDREVAITRFGSMLR